MSVAEIERLREVLPRLSVVHHVPGRARLKLNGKLPAWILENSIDRSVKTLKGVTNVCVNPFSASAVVTYDKNELPPSLFEALSEGDYEPLLERARSSL
jgi:copper chaperone CopZ